MATQREGEGAALDAAYPPLWHAHEGYQEALETPSMILNPLGWRNLEKTVTLLLHAGAYIFPTPEEGPGYDPESSAFFCACVAGSAQFVRLCLNEGKDADVNFLCYGESTLFRLLQNPQFLNSEEAPIIVDLLVNEFMADPDLASGDKNQNMPALSGLFCHIANMYSAPNRRNTSTRQAYKGSSQLLENALAAVSSLLNGGRADPNRADDLGMTPLHHFAVAVGSVENYYRAKETEDGVLLGKRTPEECVEHMRTFCSMCALLIRADAGLLCKSGDGRTPLEAYEFCVKRDLGFEAVPRDISKKIVALLTPSEIEVVV
jgi:hypothetical protein